MADTPKNNSKFLLYFLIAIPIVVCTGLAFGVWSYVSKQHALDAQTELAQQACVNKTPEVHLPSQTSFSIPSLPGTTGQIKYHTTEEKGGFDAGPLGQKTFKHPNCRVELTAELYIIENNTTLTGIPLFIDTQIEISPNTSNRVYDFSFVTDKATQLIQSRFQKYSNGNYEFIGYNSNFKNGVFGRLFFNIDGHWTLLERLPNTIMYPNVGYMENSNESVKYLFQELKPTSDPIGCLPLEFLDNGIKITKVDSTTVIAIDTRQVECEEGQNVLFQKPHKERATGEQRFFYSLDQKSANFLPIEENSVLAKTIKKTSEIWKS